MNMFTDPPAPAPLYTQIRSACEAGEVETAVERIEELLQQAPDHRGALFYLGQIFQATGDLENALEAFAQALERPPEGLTTDDPAASESLLRDCLSQCCQELARFHYEQALELDEQCEPAQAGLRRLGATTDDGQRTTDNGRRTVPTSDPRLPTSNLQPPTSNRQPPISESQPPMPPDVYDLPAVSRPPRVVWCGDFFNYYSLALVNRELCRHLLEFECELSGEPLNPPDFSAEEDPARLEALARCSQAPLSGPPDVMVHHGWPEPKFRPPGMPTWIVIQPWEYGFLPRIWVEGFTTLADEIWGPSHYVRQCYIDSGVPPDKVVVIPNGVDPDRFRPDVPPLPLQTDKSFKFLFVGGTIWRKGIDLLLQAYLRAFRSDDDVCLVLKDVGGQSLYQDNQIRRLMDSLRSSPQCAEVLELEGFLSDAQIAALYTAGDCLVHPYRGEGFGLPIVEAMACGRPVIVTAGGASDDFCTDDTAIRVASRILEGVPRDFHDYQPIREPWVREPDAEQLADWMRHVYEHREEAQALGQAARAHIGAHFTWRHAAEKAYARLGRTVGQEELGE